MSRQRNAQLQAALARVEAGERVSSVAADMGLQTAAIYQARRMERAKAERVRADAEMRRNARRYEKIRLNPAWETEAFLDGLSPEEFDEAVDKRFSD